MEERDKDISNIRDLELALADSERRIKSIIETAVDGIITMSDRAIIETINPAGAKIFGYDPKEVIGYNIKMLMPEPDKSQHDTYVKNYQNTRKKKIIGIGREVIGLKKDGSTFPFRLAVSEVKLEGKIIYTGIIHDISEQKKAEKSLQELNEKLELRVKKRTDKLGEAVSELETMNSELEMEMQKRAAAEKDAKEALAKEVELGELKSRFVSMASHEFRTPLGGILSSISLIARYNAPEQEEKRNKHVKRIKKAVSNLTSILNDFLSLDKLEQGKVTMHPISFDIKAFCLDVVEEIEQVKRTGQSISYSHKGNEREVVIDTTIFKNILLNLLSNAVKYSRDDDEIIFTSEISQGRVIVIIEDKGIGIPKEEQEHLFERFFRAKNALNLQGTGLGLNIVKKYIDLMNGTIELKSEQEVGTKVSLDLPQRTKVIN